MTTTTPDVITAGDPAMENWLDTHHIPWRYDPNYPLNRIDMKRSLANQARVGEPLNDDAVERYTNDYRRGDTFPPLLVRDMGRAKPYLLGGNHRTTAAQAAGITHHPAYIVTIDADAAALTLMYGDNRRHGIPPAKQERLAQAAHLVDNGWTAKDAAQLVGVTEPALSNYRNVTRNSRRAAELGIGVLFDQLPYQHRARLSTLKSDPVFVETVKVVGYARLNQTETNTLVGQVKDARSDNAALKVIGSAQEELRSRMQDAASKRKPNRITPYGTANAAITTILSIDWSAVSAPDQVSHERLIKRAHDAALHLADGHKHLKARPKAA